MLLFSVQQHHNLGTSISLRQLFLYSLLYSLNLLSEHFMSYIICGYEMIVSFKTANTHMRIWDYKLCILNTPKSLPLFNSTIICQLGKTPPFSGPKKGQKDELLASKRY